MKGLERELLEKSDFEELECEVHVDGIRLEYALEFKYLGCVLDESGTAGAECSTKGDDREKGCRCHEAPS